MLLLEANDRPGGAVYSEAFTLPGYLHDVGAAFFPFGSVSPAFRNLDLAGAGLEWRNARRESCHPAPDGSSVSISRDLDSTVASFGVDGPAWRRLAEWQRVMGSRLTEALLAPLLQFGPVWRLGVGNLAWLGAACLAAGALAVLAWRLLRRSAAPPGAPTASEPATAPEAPAPAEAAPAPR